MYVKKMLGCINPTLGQIEAIAQLLSYKLNVA